MSTTIQQFQACIIKTRDVLRRDGITGMDSMKHCTLYLAARYLSGKRLEELRIPDRFSWENILALSREGNGDGEKTKNRELSRDRIFNNGGADCLVNHFDSLFKTTEFVFRVTPRGHSDIMETLAPINMEAIELEMDLLGWVYEQHLQKGSSAARDLGQFFTDRSVTKYMTELCDPKLRADGTIESICDPSMGTGGFLTSAVQHLRKKHGVTNEMWKANKDRIQGCDIDRFVGAVASINLFMETHGTVFPHVSYRDSLKDDVVLPGYDVILANMPFGVKGLKFADVCSRVKALKLDGTKSEPLFLQLMMASLAPGGRCAVVVPDGMLANSSKCHIGTRKYLLDKFELKRVIKMKGQFFMNTGIQPSILFFEHNEYSTSEVEFWDVERMANGEIKETLITTVHYDDFNEECSFDARRYMKEDTVVANPAGYPMVKLGDIATCKNGKNVPQEKRLETGKYPYFASNGVSGFVEQFNFEGPAALLGDQGSSWMKSSHYVTDNSKFYAGNHTIVMKANNPSLNIKFLYYYLKLSNLLKFNKCSALIPEIDKVRFFQMEFPLPPRSIQDEIVATLDRIYNPGTTELTDTLKLTDRAMELVLKDATGALLQPIVDAHRLINKSAQMVADVKAQMVADVKAQMVAVVKASLLSNDSIPAKLGDILKHFTTGKNQNDLIEGEYPFYMANGVSKSYTTFQFDGEYVLNGRCGSKLGESCYYVNGKFSASDFTYVLQANTEKMLNRFLYYYISCVVDWNKYKSGTSMPNLPRGAVTNLDIRIPSIEIQTQTLQRLNALQIQLSSLENLSKQAEDNARFILDSYLNTV